MQLHDYQVKYLDGLAPNCIMTADVGLGKTILSLEHYKRHNPNGRLVVVAPASKVKTGDWEREIERYFANPPDYTVIGYEMFTKKWKELVDEDITIIVDEGHMACNAETKRAKAIITVARVAKQWIILSATPLPNGWRSATSYALLTGLTRTKTDFVRRFIVIDRSRGFPIILDYREEPLLEKWWASISKPLQRTGDLRLPSDNIPVEVPLPAGLKKDYKRAVKDRIYGDELLDNPSKVFVTLRQIPNPARIDALHNILEGTDEHVVVFYNFNSERDAIHELLSKHFKNRKVYEQSGKVSNLPERSEWDTLKQSVTLAQYQSASQAIELTYASVTVYLSPCTSYANYDQSKGRTRRNGQKKTTLFYHIAVEGTLDKHIWKILKKKRDFSVEMIEKILDKS